MAELALSGGPKAKTRPFPAWPVHDEAEREALLGVLESGVWWRTPGTRTKAFEERFAAYQGARFGVAVTNGTHALEVVIAALGLGPGDEVIVPDFTFVATASAVLSVGAVPVMVDVRPDTYCIDPAAVDAAVTSRTRAVICVHMGGHPADLDALTRLCGRRGIPLVEDSSHAHSSEWRGVRVGAIGTAGTFSFQASKLMTAGEGGMVVTNDPGLEAAARSVHDCGRLPGRWFYDHYSYGSNYRLSEWQGAVLSAQLERAAVQTARRFANARLLADLLSGIEGVTPQALDPRCTHNGQYAFIYHWDAAKFGGISRERYIEAVKAEGIPEQASYPPLHALDLFRGGLDPLRRRLGARQARRLRRVVAGRFPGAERGAYETVWVPQTALLGDERDTREIAAAVLKIQRNWKELA
jgi:dTDP-4-amino-4,6-dideoxygalactose transaminase